MEGALGGEKETVQVNRREIFEFSFLIFLFCRNAEENATAAANGEILVDDSQKFSLTAKEKIFFKNLPNYSAALGQVASR